MEYLPAESRAHYKVLEEHFRAKSLIFSDPPDHTRLRALVTKVFNATRVEEMRPRITELIDKLVGDALDRGRADVINDIAVPLPFTIVGAIIGVPASDQDNVKRWADELLAFQGLNKPPEAILKISQQALIDFRAYISELIRERRRTPRAELVVPVAWTRTRLSGIGQQFLRRRHLPCRDEAVPAGGFLRARSWFALSKDEST